MSDKGLSLYASFWLFLRHSSSKPLLKAGYTLLKIRFKHLKYSHVYYSLEHFVTFGFLHHLQIYGQVYKESNKQRRKV